MKVPGLNSGKVFYQHFNAPFYTVVTALLEHLDPTILHLFGFCFIIGFATQNRKVLPFVVLEIFTQNDLEDKENNC